MTSGRLRWQSRSLSALLALVACATDGPDRQWVVVRRGDLVLGVEVTGVLEAVDSTPLRPPPIPNTWDFKIASMAEEGKEVKKGDEVLSFDTSELMRSLQKLQNDAEAAAKEVEKRESDAQMARQDDALRLAEAEANLRKAELKSDRPSEIAAGLDLQSAEIDRKIAAVSLDGTRASIELKRRHDVSELEALRDKMAFAKAELEQAQASAGRMTVLAPRSGTLIYPGNWRGEKKKVGDSVWRMENVLEIVGLDEMKAKGEVDEAESSRVAVGQRVTLRLDAHPDDELVGKVASLGDAVGRKSPTNPAKVVRLKIQLEDKRGLPLRPGMRFRGSVETGRIGKALTIPVEALVITPKGPAVYRRAGGGSELVSVQVGARNASDVEVQVGLREGDQVERPELSQESPKE